MAVLSGKRIKQRFDDPDFNKRLIIKPILEPSSQLRDGQASIDIRLGSDFALIVPSSYGQVDELQFTDSSHNLALPKLYRKHYVPLGENIVLHPHQLLLANTLEYLRLPLDLMSYVVGRSTWGRLGLIVATAVGIQPGFAGCLTLELRNLGETPLTLWPGQTIAQLFFHDVDTDQTQVVIGQYCGATDILPKKISSDTTLAKLKALKTKLSTP